MKHILVVDDSTTNLKFIENALQYKYRLAMAKNGERALKYLEKAPVDLILLDIMMPGMDGFETFENIKKMPLNANTPVIFFTADSNVENEIRGLKMGAADFIRKPFVPEVVLNRISNILKLNELKNDLEKKVEEKTKQIEQISFETIATIASMIEAKDRYTKGHSVRVSEYSARLANKLGWDEEKIQNLRYIALLHDIGKVGIPDKVLNKPGKLTDIEYEIIKSHTTLGGSILAEVETIPGVDLGAKYHHERYDGKGYPEGLVGTEIPKIARIISICDAYDAMNSKRVYRDRLPREEIIKQFEAGKNTQFDGHYVEMFLALLNNGELDIEDEIKKNNRKKTISAESSDLLNQIMKNIEQENQKQEKYDFLTGLLNRKNGENEITESLKQDGGCLAFVDLDNLKKTNDIMGHLAGDYAIKGVGEVLRLFGENAIISRIGGDEFLYYMVGVDEETAKSRIQTIMNEFNNRKSTDTNLKFSSLSIGLCMAQKDDVYADVLAKADKALYHVKNSGKAGYYIHTNQNEENNYKNSVDLNKIVKSFRENNAYEGALNLENREFYKVYHFIQNLVERFGYKMQLLMLTLEPNDYDKVDVDEQEHAMKCMETAIKESLRNVDICTRFSSKEFFVVLINAGRENMEKVSNRIFDRFYKVYDNNAVKLSYDIADLESEESILRKENKQK